MSADPSSQTMIAAHSRTASGADSGKAHTNDGRCATGEAHMRQESGPFESIELTEDAMQDPKAPMATTTMALDGDGEPITIAAGLEVVPSLLPDPELPHLKRALGWMSLTSMGVGATIGAGIFVMTGIVAHDVAGPAISISFVVAAIACGLSGLCYVRLSCCCCDRAEFAALAPSAGSAYAYTRATMGQFLAFMLGWDLVLEYTVAGAAVAQSWSQYFNEFLGLFGTRIPAVISSPPFGFVTSKQQLTSSDGVLDLPALLVSLLIMTLLIHGVRDSARFNNVMVAIKVGIVLFIIILGAFLVDVDNFSPFAPFGWLGVSFFGRPLPGQHHTAEGHAAGMLAGASLVFFAFLGFDSVSCQAEEARRPSRDLPVGILLSLVISTSLYVAVSIVITGMVPYQEINIRAPLSTAFGHRGFQWAQYLIAIGAVVGILSVLLMTMLAQPRIFMAMARDGLLPPFFASVHPTYRTPWKGTMLTGIVVGVVSSTIPLTILVEFVSIGTLLAFTFVCISVLILRHTQPDLHRPFRCPLVPVVPILGALLCILLMFSLPATNWYRLGCWFALGIVIYLLYGRKHGIGERHRMYGQPGHELIPTPPAAPPSGPGDSSTGLSKASTLSDVMNLQRQKGLGRNQSDSATAPVQVHVRGRNNDVARASGSTDGSGAAAATVGSNALASPPLGYDPTMSDPSIPAAGMEQDRGERRLQWADEMGKELRLQAPPPASYTLTPTASVLAEEPAQGQPSVGHVDPPAEMQISGIALTNAGHGHAGADPEPPPFDYQSLRVKAPGTPQTPADEIFDPARSGFGAPSGSRLATELPHGEDIDERFPPSLPDDHHPIEIDPLDHDQQTEYRYSTSTASTR